MIKTDYLIVGLGLAGIAFCEQLRKHGKRFLVFNNTSQQSSIVAAGLYNPVILKRFTPVWKAKEQLDLAIPIYSEIEKNLKIKINYPLRIFRQFTSVEEQNHWFYATDRYKLTNFLSSKLIRNSNKNIAAPLGYGEVLHGGRLDTHTLINAYKKFLHQNKQLLNDSLNYTILNHNDERVIYKDIIAKKIIFAEGFGVKQNPYFNDLPINGTKGEILTIKAPRLKIDYVIKSSVFVIPVENNLYKVGSTYDWIDKTNTPTKRAKTELVKKLKTIISCDFKIIKHSAGLRPTVKDRRPIVGHHPKYKNFFILNGLGSRGVMNAPYIAQILYKFIENGTPICNTISIERFCVSAANV